MSFMWKLWLEYPFESYIRAVCLLFWYGDHLHWSGGFFGRHASTFTARRPATHCHPPWSSTCCWDQQCCSSPWTVTCCKGKLIGATCHHTLPDQSQWILQGHWPWVRSNGLRLPTWSYPGFIHKHSLPLNDKGTGKQRKQEITQWTQILLEKNSNPGDKERSPIWNGSKPCKLSTTKAGWRPSDGSLNLLPAKGSTWTSPRRWQTAPALASLTAVMAVMAWSICDKSKAFFMSSLPA